MLNHKNLNTTRYTNHGPVLILALVFFLGLGSCFSLVLANSPMTAEAENIHGAEILCSENFGFDYNASKIINSGKHLDHDFHVSVMRVDYNPETKALEVTLKLFTDDIEKSLEELGAPALRLGSPRELPESDTIFSEYLNNRLAFFVDDQQMAFDFLGKEVEMDNTTWCYLEVKGIESFTSLRIQNKVLMELFDDQTNLVNIFAFGKKKSFLLRGGLPEDRTTF